MLSIGGDETSLRARAECANPATRRKSPRGNVESDIHLTETRTGAAVTRNAAAPEPVQ
jgi:hypothetical protein